MTFRELIVYGLAHFQELDKQVQVEILSRDQHGYGNRKKLVGVTRVGGIDTPTIVIEENDVKRTEWEKTR